MVAFNAISSYHNRKEDFSWDIVWPWKGPQSIYMFLWLVTHNRLKTKAELARRHILADVGCDCFGCGGKGYVACAQGLHGCETGLASFCSCGGTAVFLRSTFKGMALV